MLFRKLVHPALNHAADVVPNILKAALVLQVVDDLNPVVRVLTYLLHHVGNLVQPTLGAVIIDLVSQLLVLIFNLIQALVEGVLVFIVLVLLDSAPELGDLVSQLLVITIQFGNTTGIVGNLAALLGVISRLVLLLAPVARPAPQ